MFSLFKRKKVADKKPITPCVCDNGDMAVDALTLQEFGSHSDSETTLASRLHQLGEGGRAYHRLQPPPSPPNDSLHPESSSGSESSSDNERDYFGGFTDSEDEDEELTCNFCECTFHSVRRLEQHQQRKRHYMCSICDTVFDGLMLLEMHKETLDHWSDYELKLKKVHERDSDSDSDELEEHRVYSGRRRAGDELRRLLL